MGVGIMKLASIPIGILTSVILARGLGPEVFGQYVLVMSLVPLLALPVAGGLPQFLTREIAVYSHAGQWHFFRGLITWAHRWVLWVSLLVVFVYYMLRLLGVWEEQSRWQLLGLAIILVPLNGLNSIRSGTIKGLRFPVYAELPGQLILPVILFVGSGLLLYSDKLTAASAIWMQIIGNAAIFVMGTLVYLKIRPHESQYVKSDYRNKAWFSSVHPFTLLALAGTFNAQAGIVLLGMLSTDENVAALRVAERGAQFVALSLMLVNLVIAPYIVRMYRESDMRRLQDLSRKSALGAFMIALPVALALIIFGQPIINFAFGVEYSEIAYLPLIILVVGQLVNVFCGSVGYLLSMSGHERVTLYSQLFSLILNLGLCVALVPSLGAVGAALSIGISLVIWNLILVWMVNKYIGIRSTAF